MSLAYGEHDAPAFAISIAITLTFAFAMWWPTRNRVPSISRRESFAIVSLGWIFISAAASLPYMPAGTFSSFTDAYFESMSGVTTTGASVIVDIEAHPHAILFGGLHAAARRDGHHRPLRGDPAHPGGRGRADVRVRSARAHRLKTHPRIRQTAKALWFIYLGLSGTEVVLLMLRGLTPFDAVTHMFGTMATGGYSPWNKSVGYYNDPLVDIIITVFMAAAGMSFGLYFLFLRGQRSRILLDREFRLYMAIIGGAIVLVVADLVANLGLGIGDALRYAAFQVVVYPDDNRVCDREFRRLALAYHEESSSF